jgi:Domain of unknown function (DUF6457)
MLAAIARKILSDMTDSTGTRDLLTELAAKLRAARGSTSLETVGLAGRARLLRIARDVAHATERQNAPLAAYLIGRFVQDAVRSGTSEAEAIDQAAAIVRSLIGEPSD